MTPYHDPSHLWNTYGHNIPGFHGVDHIVDKNMCHIDLIFHVHTLGAYVHILQDMKFL